MQTVHTQKRVMVGQLFNDGTAEWCLTILDGLVVILSPKGFWHWSFVPNSLRRSSNLSKNFDFSRQILELKDETNCRMRTELALDRYKTRRIIHCLCEITCLSQETPDRGSTSDDLCECRRLRTNGFLHGAHVNHRLFACHFDFVGLAFRSMIPIMCCNDPLWHRKPRHPHHPTREGFKMCRDDLIVLPQMSAGIG